jgi:RNA polymerase sigma-70 factor (ECF subfamily)
VYRFVYLRTRHKETAEDITSETFLKAFAHFENFDTNRLLLPWLYRIAHNALIDHWRKERPGFSLDENWDSPSEDPTPLEIAVTSEKNKEALALLEKLNPLEKNNRHPSIVGPTFLPRNCQCN